MASVQDLQNIATQVRRDIVRMTNGASSGHPGGSMGCADYFTALYFSVLNHSTDFNMQGDGEDLFFLSNGHISPVWYSVLSRSGYFPVKELATFRKIDSRLQGHPTTMEHLPGVRVASGSLGQGMSVALGAAQAKKLNGDKSLVYSLHGDGELQEGQIWEAAMYAAHNKVDNLISAIDWNSKQIDGDLKDVLDLGDLKQKWDAFGWGVLEVDGNDMEALLEIFKVAKERSGNGKPIMIIMKTIMGKGVDFMEDDHGWHGVAPNDEQLKAALTQLESSLDDY